VGRVTIAANETFNLAYNGVSGTGTGLNFDIANGASAIFSNLYTIDLSTNAGAERALMIVSKALQKVDTIRSQIGATMNNLQSIFDAQKVGYDNTKQAENVIRNTDYAEEMSNFTRYRLRCNPQWLCWHRRTHFLRWCSNCSDNEPRGGLSPPSPLENKP